MRAPTKAELKKRAAAAEQRLEKAQKAVASAELLVNYFLEALSYKAVSTEYCQKRKLCTCCVEEGTLHCAQKAVTGYRHRDEKVFKKRGTLYVCSRHIMQVSHIPKDMMWVDVKTGEPKEDRW